MKGLQQKWGTVRTSDRRVFAAMSAAVLFLIAVTFAILGWAAAAKRDNLIQVHALVAGIAALAAPSSDEQRGADFTQLLPLLSISEALVRDASVWAGKLHLRLAALSVQPATTASALLPRVDIFCELRGAYPDVKLWLRELLARYAGLGLVSVDVRRLPGTAPTTEVTAVLQLRLIGRPEAPASIGVQR